MTYYRRKRAPAKKSATRKRVRAKKAAPYRRRTKAQEKMLQDSTTGIIETARDVGTGVGNMVFPGLGGIVGGGIGSLIGNGIKWFTGKGEYQIQENSLLYPSSGVMTPIINRDPGGGVLVRRCEYMGDVTSSATAGAFNITSYDINPGLDTTFQWLSQVASNFDEWVCEGMYFEFRSMSSDALNSTNTALGSVIMSAQYNSTAPNFTSKQQMENYEGGVSIKPSESVRYFVECARNRTVLNDLYVRAGAVPAGQDQRFFDLANFQIATNGLQGTNVNVGELWVCYQISLRKPKLFSSLGLYDSFAKVTTTTGVSGANPLGTLGSWSVDVSSNLVVTQVSSTVLTVPIQSLPQTYIYIFAWGGTSTNTVPPTFTFSNGLTGTGLYQNGSLATGEVVEVYYVTQLANQASPGQVNLGAAGTLPTAPNRFSLIITQVPNTYLGSA